MSALTTFKRKWNSDGWVNEEYKPEHDPLECLAIKASIILPGTNVRKTVTSKQTIYVWFNLWFFTPFFSLNLFSRNIMLLSCKTCSGLITVWYYILICKLYKVASDEFWTVLAMLSVFLFLWLCRRNLRIKKYKKKQLPTPWLVIPPDKLSYRVDHEFVQ